MSPRAFVVESRLHIGPVRNLRKRVGRTNEFREFVKPLDRVTPPVSLRTVADIETLPKETAGIFVLELTNDKLSAIAARRGRSSRHIGSLRLRSRLRVKRRLYTI